MIILFFVIASLGYAHIKLQQELRDANVAQEKAQYIYYNTKLLAPVIYFPDPV